MLIPVYEDANDVFHLQNGPLFKDIPDGDLASQPTVSGFGNGTEKQTVFAEIISACGEVLPRRSVKNRCVDAFDGFTQHLCYACIDRYLSALSGRIEVITDIDSTGDPTRGTQQLSLFNGYYGQFMYGEPFFHDGATGQLILPVLRPGNSHSSRWHVSILFLVIT